MLPPATDFRVYPEPVCRAEWERVESGFSGAAVWKGSIEGVPHYALKCWPENCSEERLEYIHRSQSNVSRLPFVPKLIRANDGTTFRLAHNRYWDVSTWMPGEMENREEFPAARRRAAVNALLSVHRLWAGSWRRSDVCPAVKRRLMLIDDYRMLSRSQTVQQCDPLIMTILARLPGPLDHAERVLQPWICQHVPIQNCFTDIHRDHALFTGDDVTGLIDYGAVKMDCPAVDLARLFGDHEATLAAAFCDYGEEDLPARLCRDLAATAPACNLAAWTLRIFRDEGVATNEPAVRRRISNWVDRLR